MGPNVPAAPYSWTTNPKLPLPGSLPGSSAHATVVPRPLACPLCATGLLQSFSQTPVLSPASRWALTLGPGRPLLAQRGTGLLLSRRRLPGRAGSLGLCSPPCVLLPPFHFHCAWESWPSPPPTPLRSSAASAVSPTPTPTHPLLSLPRASPGALPLPSHLVQDPCAQITARLHLCCLETRLPAPGPFLSR